MNSDSDSDSEFIFKDIFLFVTAQVPDWAGLFEVLDADGSGTLQWDELREGQRDNVTKREDGNRNEKIKKMMINMNPESKNLRMINMNPDLRMIFILTSVLPCFHGVCLLLLQTLAFPCHSELFTLRLCSHQDLYHSGLAIRWMRSESHSMAEVLNESRKVENIHCQ